MTRVIAALLFVGLVLFGVGATLLAWDAWRERRRARRAPARRLPTCGLCLAPMYTNDLYCWPCDVAVREVRAMARARRPA